MTEWFECRACSRVGVHKKDDPLKCDACGSSDVYLVSYEQAAEALKGGAYPNLDVETGKPKSR